MIEYLPFENRTPDKQYKDLLEAILKKGKSKEPIHASLEENKGSGHSYALELTGKACCLEFDLSNGFPIFGYRSLRKVVPSAIGEIVGFLNGARRLNELEKFGAPERFWGAWVTAEKCAKFGLEKGDLGDGSYGPALRAFPTNVPAGNGNHLYFDQLSALNETMRVFPKGRGILLTTWIPHLAAGSKAQGFDRKVVVAPCHGTFFHVHIFPELGEMEVTCVQRSGDVPVGVLFNVSQWCTLGLVLSMIHGLKFTKYTHFISSAQIYDIQIPFVEKVLALDDRIFPTVELHPPTPYQHPADLRKEHFIIGDDYDPHPWFTIPTPV